ncbi:MAG: hypothetical protein KJ808_07835 [Acidobacteria bacterium]|nr:hypothetical protein [Acidobacteriota bacterium]MBU4306968.1 hypothetical protein [Acidobacteriota bacterium]MBU4405622.1 hypothetical protein [Acidobacteriota bacterium]MCG2812169.1 hypothetical protein [Candidatus Aminicenantes bacterium]
MRKITYNLAATRKIKGWSFAFRAAVLVLAIVALSAVAIANLGRQLQKNRAEKNESGLIGRQINKMQNRSLLQTREIAAWKKIRSKELAAANALIGRKVFSFVARLNFLEKISNPGIRIRHISLVNERAGHISMTIAARSLQELFALYKELTPYELVIASENQTNDEYQANLNFKISNEKI